MGDSRQLSYLGNLGINNDPQAEQASSHHHYVLANNRTSIERKMSDEMVKTLSNYNVANKYVIVTGYSKRVAKSLRNLPCRILGLEPKVIAGDSVRAVDAQSVGAFNLTLGAALATLGAGVLAAYAQADCIGILHYDTIYYLSVQELRSATELLQNNHGSVLDAAGNPASIIHKSVHMRNLCSDGDSVAVAFPNLADCEMIQFVHESKWYVFVNGNSAPYVTDDYIGRLARAGISVILQQCQGCMTIASVAFDSAYDANHMRAEGAVPFLRICHVVIQDGHLREFVGYTDEIANLVDGTIKRFHANKIADEAMTLSLFSLLSSKISKDRVSTRPQSMLSGDSPIVVIGVKREDALPLVVKHCARRYMNTAINPNIKVAGHIVSALIDHPLIMSTLGLIAKTPTSVKLYSVKTSFELGVWTFFKPQFCFLKSACFLQPMTPLSSALSVASVFAPSVLTSDALWIASVAANNEGYFKQNVSWKYSLAPITASLLTVPKPPTLVAGWDHVTAGLSDCLNKIKTDFCKPMLKQFVDTFSKTLLVAQSAATIDELELANLLQLPGWSALSCLKITAYGIFGSFLPMFAQWPADEISFESSIYYTTVVGPIVEEAAKANVPGYFWYLTAWEAFKFNHMFDWFTDNIKHRLLLSFAFRLTMHGAFWLLNRVTRKTCRWFGYGTILHMFNNYAAFFAGEYTYPIFRENEGQISAYVERRVAAGGLPQSVLEVKSPFWCNYLINSSIQRNHLRLMDFLGNQMTGDWEQDFERAAAKLGTSYYFSVEELDEVMSSLGLDKGVREPLALRMFERLKADYFKTHGTEYVYDEKNFRSLFPAQFCSTFNGKRAFSSSWVFVGSAMTPGFVPGFLAERYSGSPLQSMVQFCAANPLVAFAGLAAVFTYIVSRSASLEVKSVPLYLWQQLTRHGNEAIAKVRSGVFHGTVISVTKMKERLGFGIKVLPVEEKLSPHEIIDGVREKAGPYGAMLVPFGSMHVTDGLVTTVTNLQSSLSNRIFGHTGQVNLDYVDELSDVLACCRTLVLDQWAAAIADSAPGINESLYDIRHELMSKGYEITVGDRSVNDLVLDANRMPEVSGGKRNAIAYVVPDIFGEQLLEHYEEWASNMVPAKARKWREAILQFMYNPDWTKMGKPTLNAFVKHEFIMSRAGDPKPVRLIYYPETVSVAAMSCVLHYAYAPLKKCSKFSSFIDTSGLTGAEIGALLTLKLREKTELMRVLIQMGVNPKLIALRCLIMLGAGDDSLVVSPLCDGAVADEYRRCANVVRDIGSWYGRALEGLDSVKDDWFTLDHASYCSGHFLYALQDGIEIRVLTPKLFKIAAQLSFGKLRTGVDSEGNPLKFVWPNFLADKKQNVINLIKMNQHHTLLIRLLTGILTQIDRMINTVSKFIQKEGRVGTAYYDTSDEYRVKFGGTGLKPSERYESQICAIYNLPYTELIELVDTVVSVWATAEYNAKTNDFTVQVVPDRVTRLVLFDCGREPRIEGKVQNIDDIKAISLLQKVGTDVRKLAPTNITTHDLLACSWVVQNVRHGTPPMKTRWFWENCTSLVQQTTPHVVVVFGASPGAQSNTFYQTMPRNIKIQTYDLPAAAPQPWMHDPTKGHYYNQMQIPLCRIVSSTMWSTEINGVVRNFNNPVAFLRSLGFTRFVNWILSKHGEFRILCISDVYSPDVDLQGLSIPAIVNAFNAIRRSRVDANLNPILVKATTTSVFQKINTFTIQGDVHLPNIGMCATGLMVCPVENSVTVCPYSQLSGTEIFLYHTACWGSNRADWDLTTLKSLLGLLGIAGRKYLQFLGNGVFSGHPFRYVVEDDGAKWDASYNKVTMSNVISNYENLLIFNRQQAINTAGFFRTMWTNYKRHLGVNVTIKYQGSSFTAFTSWMQPSGVQTTSGGNTMANLEECLARNAIALTYDHTRNEPCFTEAQLLLERY